MAPRKPKPVAKDSRRIVFGESSAKGKTHYIMNILSHESLAKVDFRHVDAAKEKPRATKVLRKEWRTRRANRTKAVNLFCIFLGLLLPKYAEHQRTSKNIQHHPASFEIMIHHHPTSCQILQKLLRTSPNMQHKT